MKTRTPALLAAVLGIMAAALPAASGPAVAQLRAPNECDRLAASPTDTGRFAPPVEFDDIDGPAAEAACKAALAAAPGDPRTAYQLGRAFDAQDRFEDARATYQQAIDAGFLPAMTALGKLDELGLDAPPDFAKAIALYRRALDGGLPYAAGDLAYLYQQGLGVDRDAAEAARLFGIAAEAGDAWAEVDLGQLYEHGEGVETDLPRAVELYRRSAQKGNPIGQFRLGFLYATGKGVPRDDAEAVKWLELSAARDFPAAYLALARIYRSGDPALRNDEEAERLFLIALFTNDDDVSWRAANELAWMWARSGERLDEAKDMIENALASAPPDDPETPGVFDTAALVALRMGDAAAALEYQEKAVEASPDFAPFHDRLGDIYAALGRADDARAAWEKALALPVPAEPGDWDRDAISKKLAN